MLNIANISNISRLGGGSGRGTSSTATPSFVAGFANNLALTSGSGVAEFQRSSVAVMSDFESLLKSSLSAESRFTGTRRVRNLCQYSEDFSNAVWVTYSAGTKVGNTSIIGPSGSTETVMEFVFTNAGGGVYQAGLPAGKKVSGSIWIRTKTGTGNMKFYLQGYSPNIALTTTWQRVTYAGVIAGDTVLYIEGFTAGMEVYMTKAQAEVVTGQTNQVASEYVSTNVLSSPYHGANVDGVKYFTTENGNTESSNIVTEATGATINSSLIPGVAIEGQVTNVLTRSTAPDLWTLNLLTLGASSVSPSGDSNAYLFTASGGAGQHMVYDYPTVTLGNVYTLSVYAQAGDSNFLCLGCANTNATDQEVAQIFDLSDGTLGQSHQGSTSGILHDSSIEQVGDFYRCTMTFSIATGSSFRNAISIAPAKTGNTFNGYGVVEFTSTGAESIIMWGKQLEELPRASSIIETAGATATRVSDRLRYDVSGNLTTTTGTIILSYTPTFDALTGNTIFLFGSYVDSSNYTAILHDGTNFIFRKRISGTNTDATIASSFVSGTTYKIGVRFGTSGQDIWVDGVKGTNNANTSALQLDTVFEIGSDGNNANHAYGSIKNISIYNSALSDATIQTLTS